jgi:hypothetical protein
MRLLNNGELFAWCSIIENYPFLSSIQKSDAVKVLLYPCYDEAPSKVFPAFYDAYRLKIFDPGNTAPVLIKHKKDSNSGAF